MATDKQKLGTFGETVVVKNCACPRCKRAKSLKKLPPNFKCADIICDFCGFLAQVKCASSKDISVLPKTVLGAAWGPQIERMNSAIYFPLFLVLAQKGGKEFAIYYLPSDLQNQKLFVERNPLKPTAKRAGWKGFYYDIASIHSHFVRLS